MIKVIKIQNKIIGENQPAFIVAEAGVNHNANLKTAYRLIDIAKKCGADAIKFQTYLTEECTHSKLKKAIYQKKNTPNFENQFQMLKRLELNFTDYVKIKKHCKKKKIIFFSTPSDLSSLKLLKKLKVPCIKISSVDLNNISLIKEACKLNVPLFISTGMSNIDQIFETLKIVKKNKKKIIFLHCVSSYPTDIKNINLKSIEFLKRLTKCLVGFSDHTTDVFVPSIARTLGACVIEKHLTLNKNYNGPDHKISLNPKEFKLMVNQVRTTEKSFGEYKKKVLKCEINTLTSTKKVFVANRNIINGQKLNLKWLNYLSAGKGISYIDIKKYLEKKIKKNIKKSQVLKKHYF
jgi:sialic acid synthase SpsE